MKDYRQQVKCFYKNIQRWNNIWTNKLENICEEVLYGKHFRNIKIKLVLHGLFIDRYFIFLPDNSITGLIGVNGSGKQLQSGLF